MSYTYRGSRPEPARPRIYQPGIFDPAKCGTLAGHKQHQRQNIPQCEPCLEAYRVYFVEYRAKRREKAAA